MMIHIILVSGCLGHEHLAEPWLAVVEFYLIYMNMGNRAAPEVVWST